MPYLGRFDQLFFIWLRRGFFFLLHFFHVNFRFFLPFLLFFFPRTSTCLPHLFALPPPLSEEAINYQTNSKPLLYLLVGGLVGWPRLCQC